MQSETLNTPMTPIKLIEKALRGKSYEDLQTQMSGLPTEVLVELLNASSIRVGDTASSLINQRSAGNLVAEAVLKGLYTTRDGKVRAANTLADRPMDSTLRDDALIQMAQDPNAEIADNALFALVSMRRKHLISELEEIKNTSQPGKGAKKLDLAIEALSKGDPRIFNPYFRE